MVKISTIVDDALRILDFNFPAVNLVLQCRIQLPVADLDFIFVFCLDPLLGQRTHNYRSWGKVIFSQASVILFTGGGVTWSRGDGIPACLAGFQAHTQGESLGGSGGGEGLQSHTQGGSSGGSGSGPQPRGKLRGIWSRLTAKGEIEGDLAREGCLVGGGGCGGPP